MYLLQTVLLTFAALFLLHYGSTNPMLNGSIRIGILILDAM